MADELTPPASTPAAVAAVAQTGGAPPEPDDVPAELGTSVGYRIGSGVRRAARVRPYERRKGDPLYRPLRIYALDPAASVREGAVATVNVPYEPLTEWPLGALFEIDNHDGPRGVRYQRFDPHDTRVLLEDGVAPTPSDPRFHQQMLYAVGSVVYAAFKSALGRDLAWGFDRPGPEPDRLRLRPFAMDERNAFYANAVGELAFGYYQAGEEVHGRNPPHGFIFTALSHDIVVHEMTHALLDGMRAHFLIPTGPDVLALHEGLADIVALLHKFSYRQLVEFALRTSHGELETAGLLTGLARQFGHTTGSERPLRSAISEELQTYDPSLEVHALGSVLVSAVFEAFSTVYRRKTERYIRLATGGSGVLPPGELPADLRDVLAEEASQLASQFLAICIRAIDYCPPVDLELGHYLRAVITADYDLVPDDPWGYREAWIDAFAKRRIYPGSVPSLAEDALRWEEPAGLPPVAKLSFAELQFEGDPGHPAGSGELRRQAKELGRFVSHPDRLSIFGLAPPGGEVDMPCVESVRSSRRIGPDGQVVFDLVAEVTQRRTARSPEGSFDLYGGATVILGPDGGVRYAIRRHIDREDRVADQAQYMLGGGRRYWQAEEGRFVPKPLLFRLLHEP